MLLVDVIFFGTEFFSFFLFASNTYNYNIDEILEPITARCWLYIPLKNIKSKGCLGIDKHHQAVMGKPRVEFRNWMLSCLRFLMEDQVP